MGIQWSFVFFIGVLFASCVSFGEVKAEPFVEVGDVVVLKTDRMNASQSLKSAACEVANGTTGIVTRTNVLFFNSSVRGIYQVSFDPENGYCDFLFADYNYSNMSGGGSGKAVPLGASSDVGRRRKEKRSLAKGYKI